MSTRVLRFDGGRSDARRPIFLMTGCGGASGGKRGESEAVGERPVPGVPAERVVTVPTVMARGGCGRPRAGRRRCWALIQQNSGPTRARAPQPPRPQLLCASGAEVGVRAPGTAGLE